MKIARRKITWYEEKIPKDLKGFVAWEFTSGSSTGEDFVIFARAFKKFIKDNLPEESELIEFYRGHYILSGFIKRQGTALYNPTRFVYFSISDVRHFPGDWIKNILIRTAKSETDYTGGTNNYTELKYFKENVSDLL